MSKVKLRKQNKIFVNEYGVIERAGKYHWLSRETIKRDTKFDCNLNSLFIEAIGLYETLPFAIHKLWIEIIDTNTSQLMVAWNCINQKTIHDLGPFWEIYYSLKYGRGLGVNTQCYPTVAEVMKHLTTTEQKYQVQKLPKEKYLEYRRQFSDKRTFDWQMKKVQLELANMSAKKRRQLKNKTKYTWKD